MMALLPWGAYEQHGPLLPSNVDTTIAKYVADQLHRMYPDSILLEPLTYGVSIEHDGFEGTISLDYKVAIDMLETMLLSVAKNNPKLDLVIIVNGHGGNQAVASLVCQNLNYRALITKFVVFHVFPERTRLLAKTLFGHFSAHADSTEASVYAAIDDSVKEGEYNLYELGGKTSPSHAMSLFPVREISACGVVSKNESIIIDKRKGRLMLEDMVEGISESIADIKKSIERGLT